MKIKFSRRVVGVVLTLVISIHSVKAKEVSAPGELIIKYKKDVATSAQTTQRTFLKLTQTLGSPSIQAISRFTTDSSLEWIRMQNQSLANEAMEILKQDPSIEVVEPNYIYEAHDVSAPPNDPKLSEMWAIKNTGQFDASAKLGKKDIDINVMPLWNRGFVGDENLIVAVLDTGIDITHEDLKDNIFINKNEIPENGIDDDQNGLIDDVNGWNFYNQNNQPEDDVEHGTHVAGIIGASGNNGIGISGVNWKIKLLPIKMIGKQKNGNAFAAIEAVNYAVQMGAKILNISWGNIIPSFLLKEALKKAAQNNVLVVASAGNDSNDCDKLPSYPASFDLDNILSVAASDNQGKLALFSNYGLKTVDIAAPGVNILSTLPHNRYKAASGTSMATPYVSGSAALLLSVIKNIQPVDLKRRLMSTATPLRSFLNKTVSSGMINTKNALLNIPTADIFPSESQWIAQKYSLKISYPQTPNGKMQVFRIFEKNSRFLKVKFKNFDLEKGFDRLFVFDKNNELIQELTGKLPDGFISDWVSGDTLYLVLSTDKTNNQAGIEIDALYTQ